MNMSRWMRSLGLAGLAGVLVACSGSNTPAASTAVTAGTTSLTSSTASSTGSASGSASSSSSAAGSTSTGSTAPSSSTGGSSTGESAGSASGSATGPAAGGVTVQTTTGALGTFLVDGEGRTLYMFTPDTGGTSTCYDQCATAWPPLLASGTPTAGTGLEQSKLTTVARTDGTQQVVYGAWPLYYFAKDVAPGDTLGQDLNEKWYVVGTDGEPIKS